MNHYEQVSVVYFSGTGNAYSAASWFYQNVQSQNINASLHAIENKDCKLDVNENVRNLIVFAYPTHGFAPPWIMLRYMFGFRCAGKHDVAFINTQAGSKLWKYFFPGMTGIALWLPIFIFWIKGHHVRGAMSLDMPHSWVSFFPPNPTSDNISIADRCQRIVNKMSGKLLSGKKYFRYTMWLHLWFDIPVAIIAPGYLLLGRFVLAKTLFASYSCNLCRLCEKSCPVNAIKILDNRPYWKYNCESCMRCMNICPQKSIQSWTTRIGLIIYLLTLIFVTYVNLDKWIASQIVMILVFPLYWIFFQIIRIRFVNYFFTHTSLTRYWGRYFASGIKLKDVEGRDLKNKS